MGAALFESFTLTGRGDPVQLHGYFASATFLQTLGVQPAQGRLFSPQEEQPGVAQVAVLSQDCWQKHFAGDPSVVGRTAALNNTSYTIVGVLAQSLALPLDQADVFALGILNSNRYPPAMMRQGSSLLLGIARLKPGITLGCANEGLRLLSARYQQTYPDHVDAATGQKVTPLQELVVNRSRVLFYILAGAVGCVLLIACNLSLARLASRRKEIAIRVALEATRWRLARQLLTESLLLSLSAGTLGSLPAAWCVNLARSLGPAIIPRAHEIHLGGTALLFASGISLLTGILSGVAPALHAASGSAGEALQQTATEIVGIVADARTISVAELPKPQMYFSMYQRSGLSMNVYVQTVGPQSAEGLETSIRAAVRAVDPDQPVGELLEMNTLVSRSMANRRLTCRIGRSGLRHGVPNHPGGRVHDASHLFVH